MANAKVCLLRYVETGKGWRRCRVEVETTRKGRGWTTNWDDPKSYGPDVTDLGDSQLKWHVGGNAKFVCGGRDLREAAIQRDKQANTLAEETAAEKVGEKLERFLKWCRPICRWYLTLSAEKTERMGTEVYSKTENAPVPSNPSRETLKEIGARFVRLKELAGMCKKTIQQYSNLTPEFLATSLAKYADRVTEEALLEFVAALRKRVFERSVMNH